MPASSAHYESFITFLRNRALQPLVIYSFAPVCPSSPLRFARSFAPDAQASILPFDSHTSCQPAECALEPLRTSERSADTHEHTAWLCSRAFGCVRSTNAMLRGHPSEIAYSCSKFPAAVETQTGHQPANPWWSSGGANTDARVRKSAARARHALSEFCVRRHANGVRSCGSRQRASKPESASDRTNSILFVQAAIVGVSVIDFFLSLGQIL